jgi:subtilisin family serine protease
MNALEVVKLTHLMERTSGRPEIVIALIDGPVLMENPDLWSTNVRRLPGGLPTACTRASSSACMHGTYVAGVLFAKRGSPAPAICPGCTLLVHPIFSESLRGNQDMPSATPAELAGAIIEVVNAGARVLNLSIGVAGTSAKGGQQLHEALSYAAGRGVITVVAAGNEGIVGGSAFTGHPGVIPVIACDHSGQPVSSSNLSSSTGKRGLSAPGENITSFGPDGSTLTMCGTSAATPFVTGAAALLWSMFPQATASAVKLALTQAPTRQKASLMPPLLNAWAAYQTLAMTA